MERVIFHSGRYFDRSPNGYRCASGYKNCAAVYPADDKSIALEALGQLLIVMAPIFLILGILFT